MEILEGDSAMSRLKWVSAAPISVVCLIFLCLRAPMAADGWFPFDMAVEDLWVEDEKGFKTSSNVTVPEGTSLTIHCAWAIRPMQYVEVKKKLSWNGNVVRADGHTQGLFPIEIPPDQYGAKQWETGGIAGIGTTSHSVSGTKKLEGEFKTGWTAVGAGDHKLSCVLDSFDYNLDLEKVRANNHREITISVREPPQETTVADADRGAAAPGATAIGPETMTPAEAERPAEAPLQGAPAMDTIPAVTTNEVFHGRAPQALGVSNPVPNAAPAQTAVPPRSALGAQIDGSEAPPNPCRMDVTYYVPQAPVIESSSSSAQAGDQVQIKCGFETRTRSVEWPQCDDKARAEMAMLKLGQESGSRYSGMMIIDDANVGVTSSPIDGSRFENTGTWIFNEAGSHVVVCQVDNGLHVAGTDSPVHLQAAASVTIGNRTGAEEFRGFDPAGARRVTTTPHSVETVVVPDNGRIRVSEQKSTTNGRGDLINPALNPQPEVPSARQRGAGEMINPSLNPQPEVPSSRTAAPDESINPALNPQPEVPSSRTAAPDEAINPALNPQPEVPSRRSDLGNATVSTAPLPEPPSPNLENNAPEKFTSAAGQNLDQAGNARAGSTQVRQSQGAVAVNNDMNSGSPPDVAAAQPSGQSDRQLAGPTESGAVDRIAGATTWNRVVLSCEPGNGTRLKLANATSYELWASNSSTTTLNTSQHIYWRAYGKATLGDMPLSIDGTYLLKSDLPAGSQVKVGTVVMGGNHFPTCEAWAQ